MNVNGVSPKAASGNNPPASTPTPAQDAQSTFLNLLVTELKAQDPTSPMDPTQMVAQMLSMNQLNQLIQINQTLQAGLSATQPPVGGN
jgi:flagellar basal-body rod modification protein FlgD